MDNMEQKIVKQLNWYYYGIMIFSLIVLVAMYFIRKKYLQVPDDVNVIVLENYTPIDVRSQLGQLIQYFIIFDALITIPLGLYLIKWRKPTDLNAYLKLAKARILLVCNSMPLAVAAYYLMGTPKYQSMLWVAAVVAIAWYFTKPTVGKIEKEMAPEDPNIPTY